MQASPEALKRQAYTIYAVLCAAFIASQFYRVSNAVIAPELMSGLALSTATMGVITGIFFLAFAAMQIPAGILLDRYGSRLTMSSLFLVAVAGSVMFASADGAFGLIGGRALIGIGCAVGLMGSIVVIARWFPIDRYARLISLLYTLGGTGALLASTPLAAVSEAIGWRGAFLAMAGLTGVLALLLFVVVRDAPPGRGRSAAPAETPREVWTGLREVLAKRPIWWICAIQFVVYPALLSIIGLWAGPYLNDVHGLEGVARGNVLLALNLALLGSVMVFTLIERWLDSRKRTVIGGGCLSAVFLLALALIPDLGLWPAFALLMLFTVSCAYFMLLHAHARAVLSDRLMGRGLTIQNLAVMLGVFVVQSLCGVIVGMFEPVDGAAPEIAYRAVFAFLAVTIALGVAAYSRIDDVSPRREGAPSE